MARLAPASTASNHQAAAKARAVRLRTATLGRALEFWTDERLGRLRALAIRRASWDDFNAVFNGVGQSKILIGLREIIARQCEEGAP